MAQTISKEILQAALDGLRIQEQRIQGQIAEVESMLGGTSKVASTVTSDAPTGKRGKRSPAARKRMAEAQRLRWAKLKGNSEESAATEAPSPAKKRRMSKEGRAAIVAALKKRWAAKKAATKQATAKKSAPRTDGKKAAAKKSKAKTTKKVAAGPASSITAGV